MLHRNTLKAYKHRFGCDILAKLIYGEDCIIANPCPVPWRNDRHWSGSFFVSTSGESLFYDFSESKTYDSVDFLVKALGITCGEAIRFIEKLYRLSLSYPEAELAEIFRKLGLQPIRYAHSRAIPMATTPQFAWKLTPVGEEPVDFFEQIKILRGLLSTAGLSLLQRRQILRHVVEQQHDCWCLTDSSLRNANVRRLDGAPFEFGDRPKAKALWSAEGRWPVGIASCASTGYILIVEGGPDLITAATVLVERPDVSVNDWGLVGMMGVGPLHDDALPLFAGKHVRIAPQLDEASAGAGARWADQLKNLAATVSFFHLPEGVRPGKDINDAYRTNPTLLNNLFNTDSHAHL